ncbi:MAG: hypothetical protein ACO1SX_27760 [Actinomycetota bacterium]
MLTGILRAIERRQMLFVSVFALTASVGLGWHGRQECRHADLAPQELLACDLQAQVECVPAPSHSYYYIGRLDSVGGNGSPLAVEIRRPENLNESLQDRSVVLNQQLEVTRLTDAPGLPTPGWAVAIWMFIATLLATASVLISGRTR